MADFRHSGRALIRGRFAADQLILEMNFDHFAHQAVGRPADGGNLLQNRHAGLAGLQRPFQGFNLPANATYAAERAFFVFR